MLTFCVNFKVDDKLGLDPCFYFCVCANDFVSLLISWTFLTDVASKLTLWGAIYLGLISTIPWILVKFMGIPFYFGGTAVLIVIQVALDTMRKVEAQMYMSKYETLSAVGL